MRAFSRECFAAFLSHTELGELDNTLLFVLSDNGASSEGGPTGSLNDLRTWNVAGSTLEEGLERIEEIGGPFTHNNYPWGWTVAGNTPFRRWKREVHEGGVADPLIVHWPRGMEGRDEVRRQYVHAIDIVPTVLEVVGMEAPAELDDVAQQPIAGTSFASSLHDADAPSRHETQYYEMFGCRALYHQGWKAVTYHPIFDPKPPFDEDRWELYDVEEDLSECHDLAEQHPEKLQELIERWWSEAEKYQVLPLDNSPFEALFGEQPGRGSVRVRYVYYPDGGPVPEASAVNLRNRSHTITAEVEIPEGGAEGVLLAQGSGLSGYVLFVREGRLHYVHDFSRVEEHRVSSDVEVRAGAHTLAFRFDKKGEHKGTGTLFIDGAPAGAVEIPRFTPTRFSLTGDGLSCGYAAGLPVCNDYQAPFRFTGRLRRVIVDVEGRPFSDPKDEAEMAIRSQ